MLSQKVAGFGFRVPGLGFWVCRVRFPFITDPSLGSIKSQRRKPEILNSEPGTPNPEL